MADKGQVKSCAIVCGCTQFDREWFKSEIKKFDYIIAADGGYDNCAEAGVMPDILIGDFDSIVLEKPNSVPYVSYPTHKDEPDFELCLRYCAENDFNDIAVFCALGGRLDHTLSAIFTASRAKNPYNSITVYDKSTVVQFTDSTLTLENRSKYVSVFALEKDAVGVTLTGFEYPLTDYTLPCCAPLGLSNRVCAEKATVEVKNGKLAVLEIL